MKIRICLIKSLLLNGRLNNMKKVTYEYQITIDHGNDIWHWDLQDTQNVIKDIAGHKGADGFYVELVKITTKASDDIFDFGVKDYFDIFPKTEILDGLPKYVREEIDKIVIALMVGVK